jgi:hypothetical protein
MTADLGYSPKQTDMNLESKGISIPRDTEPGIQIQTSADLVDWMPLTNAAFFFRDPDSTNYNARFYRFSPK